MTKIMARLAAETLKPWTVMSIPGRLEDGSDTQWVATHRNTFEQSRAFALRSDAAAYARSRNA